MNREELIEKLAENTTDAADMSDLISFFHEKQYEYFESLPDEDLMEAAEQFGIELDDESEEEIRRRDEKNGLYGNSIDIAN
jgi:hypothetical protein